MIRPLQPADAERWHRLWDAYLHFYRGEVDPATTEFTFRRLCARRDGLFGLAGLAGDGRLAGFAHCVVHPSTWSRTPYCYLEDLFVDRTARGTGLGRQLIDGVYAEADRLGVARVYWVTQEFNSAARSLYDVVGQRTSFVVYQR
jgi:GNAT superfamily N-acetyltransferase